MKTIQHKFKNYENEKNIEKLILGTFNPLTPENKADFFYGRSHNFLWNLLPQVFGNLKLKNTEKEERIEFIKKNKIGFLDLIAEVQVDDGHEKNYADDYIDAKVTKWHDFESFLKTHKDLKKVFFTRKTFKGIPNIANQIEYIKTICSNNKIEFYLLPTPARFENGKKLVEWKKIFDL